MGVLKNNNTIDNTDINGIVTSIIVRWNNVGYYMVVIVLNILSWG